MEIAVVTGTSTGIGFATSLHLARHGYRVFAGMRNLGKAGPLRDAAAAGEPAARRRSSSTSPRRLGGRPPSQPVTGHGPVDVLVNNAGIGGATPLELTPEDEHRRMFETNYFGADPLHPGRAAVDARAAPRRHRQRHLDRRRWATPEPDPLLGLQVGARMRWGRRSPTRCAASASASSTSSPAW